MKTNLESLISKLEVRLNKLENAEAKKSYMKYVRREKFKEFIREWLAPLLKFAGLICLAIAVLLVEGRLKQLETEVHNSYLIQFRPGTNTTNQFQFGTTSNHIYYFNATTNLTN